MSNWNNELIVKMAMQTIFFPLLFSTTKKRLFFHLDAISNSTKSISQYLFFTFVYVNHTPSI